MASAAGDLLLSAMAPRTRPSASDPVISGLSDEPLDLTAAELLEEINEIDQDILEIRRKPTSSETIGQVSDLMERRNLLVDDLLHVKTSDFRQFVDSLHLHEIYAIPFHVTPRRCKITSDSVTALLNAQPGAAAVSDAEISKFLADDERHRAELTRNLQVLAKKKFLSPQETAQKIRMDAELSALKAYSPKRR
jgi:hypothetical protein